MPDAAIGFYKFTGVAVVAIDANAFDQVYHMILTAVARTDLHHAAAIHNHGYHGRIT